MKSCKLHFRNLPDAFRAGTQDAGIHNAKSKLAETSEVLGRFETEEYAKSVGLD
jgi:hypothetical protein